VSQDLFALCWSECDGNFDIIVPIVNRDMFKLLEKTRISKKFEILRECNSIAAELYLKYYVLNYESSEHPMRENYSLYDVYGGREYYFHCVKCGKEIEAEDYIDENFTFNEEARYILDDGMVICDSCTLFEDNL
jgi:hypothetical protein